MSDRDDDKHCDTCQCHEEPKWLGSHRRGPEVIPEAKALLAWSDDMGNSGPVWQFEECARIHPLFWYRDEDYENEQVAYLQWGYNYEAEHLGEPNFFYATCFDVANGDQYECATDLEIVGAVYLLMRFPERRPDHVAPEDWGYGSEVVEEMWDNHLRSVGRFAPLLARYVEVVIGNHSDDYPALRIVMDETDRADGKAGNWLEILDEVEGLSWDDVDDDSTLTLVHLADAIHEMCYFALFHKEVV